jgi:hypothetical protein
MAADDGFLSPSPMDVKHEPQQPSTQRPMMTTETADR